jgi:hypothetical protein
MGQPVILVNQTAGAIALDDLAITVPAGVGVTFDTTDLLQPEEVRASTDLQVRVNAGDIIINDGTTDLDQSESQGFMDGGGIGAVVPNSQAEVSVQQTVINEGDTILSLTDAIVSTQPDLIVVSGTNEVQLSLLAPPDVSSAVQTRNTAGITNVPLTWTDITMDTTDVETNDTVIEHDDVDRDRIQIKADGLYQLTYAGDIDDEGQIRVRVNDATVLPGSTRVYGNPADAVDLQGPLVNVFYAQLSAGDFVTPQIQALSTNENLSSDFIFCVGRFDGAEGPQGPTGPAGSQGKNMFFATAGSDTSISNTFTAVNLGTQVVASGFTHTPGTSDVTVDATGIYEIEYYINSDNNASNTRSESEARLELNTGSGFVVIPDTQSAMYHRNTAQNRNSGSASTITLLSAGDVVRLVARMESGSSVGRALGFGTGLKIIDAESSGAQGETGPQGPIGPQGPQGQPGNPEPALIGNFPITVASGVDTITLSSVGLGGTEFAASEGDSSTSSNTPVNKVTLTTSSLPAGTYRIGWYYEWSHSSTASDFRARVFVDGTTTLMEQSQEPQDARTDQRIPAGGHGYLALGSGVHTVALDFWAEGGTATIRRARLEIWRTA